jgi:hypothetical protein
MKAELPAFFIVSIIISLFTGCVSPNIPPEKIVFLKNPELLKKYELVPFQKAWKDKNVDLRHYSKIILEPVILSQHLSRNELEELNISTALGNDKNEILKFAKYTKRAFKKAIRNDPRLQLVSEPGPNTLIIRLALVKVVPGKPLFGIIRNVPIPIGKAGFLISPAAKLTGATVDSLKSSVAIEGEFIDSQTGKVVAMFADKQTETTALINMNLMSTYGTPREIVHKWAELIVKCLNRRPGEKIEAPDSIKLINY